MASRRPVLGDDRKLGRGRIREDLRSRMRPDVDENADDYRDIGKPLPTYNQLNADLHMLKFQVEKYEYENRVLHQQHNILARSIDAKDQTINKVLTESIKRNRRHMIMWIVMAIAWLAVFVVSVMDLFG